MSRWLVRAAGAALVGALAGGTCTVLWYARDPELVLEMDRDPPSFASGFYPAERAGDLTFVWTTRRADVTLRGVDRRREWTCSVVFRGARPPQFAQPDLNVAIDGVVRATALGTNEFATVTVTAPAAGMAGLRLTLTSSATFVPSVRDVRALGVQVDRLACRPTAFAWPPGTALWRAAAAASVWGAALALTIPATAAAILTTVALAGAQALLLSTHGAVYTIYPSAVLRFAVGIASLLLVATALTSARARRLETPTRIVFVCTAAVLYLKLLALAHPSKAIVDAVFHAHRLEWVLSGRYYFTQLSTSGTPFPYAIGLYVFAAPWSALTRDHVTLLRVVVCAMDAIAGLMLYAMIVRTWRDRVTGVIAAVLFSLVPISYMVIGNANLTNAFGQSVSVLTIAVAATWMSHARDVPRWLALAALAALGLTSHVSTFVLLASTLVALAAVTWWAGGDELRGAARSIVLASVVALAASVTLYWGHFGDVYANELARVRGSAASSSATVNPPASTDASVPRLGRTHIPVGGRIRHALVQTIANIGWPILSLAIIGLWRLVVERRLDRVVFAVAAWTVVGVAFVVASVVSAADVRYQQDSWEFIGRVEHAASPAAVVLAAYGVRWAWVAGTVLRSASVAMGVGAVVVGARQWVHWLW